MTRLSHKLIVAASVFVVVGCDPAISYSDIAPETIWSQATAKRGQPASFTATYVAPNGGCETVVEPRALVEDWAKTITVKATRVQYRKQMCAASSTEHHLTTTFVPGSTGTYRFINGDRVLAVIEVTE